MIPTIHHHLRFFIILLISHTAFGIPSWDGGWGWQPHLSVGSLVPRSSAIEAINEGIDYGTYKPKYLSIPREKGVNGPATVYENPSPPVFYIHEDQLWQPTNLTSILRVNVLNVTSVGRSPGQLHPAPFKLELSDDPEGIEGTWRWRGSKLLFSYGKKSNDGLYFSCQSRDGLRHVYTSLDPMPAPPGCNFMTLHSFMSRVDRP